MRRLLCAALLLLAAAPAAQGATLVVDAGADRRPISPGIYGMNFAYLPETRWHYGFYAVLGLCTSLAVGMLVYLWRKKMI